MLLYVMLLCLNVLASVLHGAACWPSARPSNEYEHSWWFLWAGSGCIVSSRSAALGVLVGGFFCACAAGFYRSSPQTCWCMQCSPYKGVPLFA
jgi:hypothetical protein